MIEKIFREIVSEEVSKLGVTIDSVIYEKEGSNYFLRILNQEGAFYKYHSSLSSYLYAAA